MNGFTDDGWSLMGSDGVEDVTIAINSSPNKHFGSQVNASNGLTTLGGGILCAKASMLLQVLMLVNFFKCKQNNFLLGFYQMH